MKTTRPSPKLSREDELALLTRHRTGDTRARDALFAACWPFVLRTARRFRTRALERDELAQVGAVGFMRGLGTYNPEKGARLLTHIAPWVIQELQRYVAAHASLLPLPDSCAARRASRAHRRGEVQAPDGLPVSLMLQEPMWAALEAKPADVDVPDDTQGPDELTQRARDIRRVRKAISRLDARGRRLVRGLLAEEGQPAMAAELGVSRQRACQLEQRALRELAGRLGATEEHLGGVRRALVPGHATKAA